MAQMFARWLGPPETLPAGMFTVNTESKRAAIACPICGAVFELPRHCAVDQTGRVTHAVQCGGSGPCGFWDFIHLPDHWLESP